MLFDTYCEEIRRGKKSVGMIHDITWQEVGKWEIEIDNKYLVGIWKMVYWKKVSAPWPILSSTLIYIFLSLISSIQPSYFPQKVLEILYTTAISLAVKGNGHLNVIIGQ